jgi:ubiquinone/menaquinone biosynthesis C-methylase UbiE
MKKRIQFCLFAPILKIKAKMLGKSILPFLKTSHKIIDLGCGDMVITEFLTYSLSQAQITGVDVINNNLTNLQLTIYDGKKLPFPQKHFDTGITILTLHHCLDEIASLEEMVRVIEKRIIIIEEVYSNPFEKIVTYAIDWILNHIESFQVEVPFNFHTDKEWHTIFQKLKLKIVSEQRVYQLPSWFLTKQKMYVLEK